MKLLQLAPLLLFLPGATPASPRPGTMSQEAPVELELAPYVSLLRTVRVRSGAHEAPFLLDTGGGTTLVTPETARALGLEPFGRASGFRHDGARVDGARAGPVDLMLGRYRRRQEVGVLDLGPLLGDLPVVGGIVALDLFDGQTVTLDLAHSRLVVETATSRAARTKDASELEVRAAHQSAGASLDLMVAIEGLHGPLWFELDCGNLASVLIAPHAYVELGLEAPEPGAKGQLELPVAGLGLVEVEAQCKDMIYDGVLNAAFCARYVLTLDLEHGRAWARSASD